MGIELNRLPQTRRGPRLMRRGCGFAASIPPGTWICCMDSFLTALSYGTATILGTVVLSWRRTSRVPIDVVFFSRTVVGDIFFQRFSSDPDVKLVGSPIIQTIKSELPRKISGDCNWPWFWDNYQVSKQVRPKGVEKRRCKPESCRQKY